MIEREEVVRKILHDLANALGSSTMALDLLDLEVQNPDSGCNDLLQTARRGLRSAAVHVAEAFEAQAMPEQPIARVPGLMERMAEIIEGINHSRPFDQTLNELAVLVEAHIPGVKVAIYLRSEANSIQLQAAPSLPQLFCDELRNMPIDDAGVGCVRAAAVSKQLRVADISSDESWGHRGSIAAEHGLTQCLSQPIMAHTDGSLHGVLEIFGPPEWDPDVLGVMLIERYQRLIALAIQSNTNQAVLLAKEIRFRTIFDSSSVAMALVDSQAAIYESNRALERLTGLDDLALATMTMTTLFESSPPNLTDNPGAASIIGLVNRETGARQTVMVSGFTIPAEAGSDASRTTCLEVRPLQQPVRAGQDTGVIDLDDLIGS